MTDTPLSVKMTDRVQNVINPVSTGKEDRMNIDLSKKDLILIDYLLSKEESEIHVAIHHCRNNDFKDYLKHYCDSIVELMSRVRNEIQVNQES